MDQIVTDVRGHPAVAAVTLVGSRRDGSAGPLSDWDFVIDSAHPERVFEELPGIIAAFEPISAFWDPLGSRRNYMATFPRLVKLDLHLDLLPLPHVPWQIDRDSLVAVDAHFWDWILWLAGKSLRGERSLVTEELVKMQKYLLGPLGCERAPKTLDEALAVYLTARRTAETERGAGVSGSRLEQEVRAALRHHNLATS